MAVFWGCPANLFSILLCCFLIGSTARYARLDVYLTRFSNPQNKNAANQCCDGEKDSSTCTDVCDIFFTICILNLQCGSPSNVILRNGSEFTSPQGNLTTPDGGTYFRSIEFVWITKKNYSFSINLYDDDSSGTRPTFGNKSSFEAVINFTQALPVSANSVPSRTNFSMNNISFEFLYRLKCTENFYGEDCATFCKPKNNTWGHWGCLANGTKFCLPDWKGKSCKTPICPDDCSNHGTCEKPRSCSCNPGWRGPSCAECIPPSRCLYATCTDPLNGQCDCKKNWAGQNCDILMTYCSHYHPCKNGMCYYHLQKNFTCGCFTGWTGRKCDKSRCALSCNRSNALCQDSGECRCHVGWTGPNCNQCVPSANCTNGSCTRPFECRCEKGWGGKSCNETAHSSICGQRNPCENNGECVAVAMGDYRCKCQSGFTGRQCQDKDLCLTRCKEGQGYCEDNECRCYNGWQGPDCKQCVLNSSCVHGFCRKPLECRCVNESWTGPFCNITAETGKKSKQVGSDGPRDVYRLIYILSSVIVLMIIICGLYFVRRRHRRRASFHVTPSSEVIANHYGKQSYTRGNGKEKTMLSLNNNVSAKPDFDNYPSSEIVLNPVMLQPSQNSRSVLIDNGPEIFENNWPTNQDSSRGMPNYSKYCMI